MANEAMGTAVVEIGGKRFDKFISLTLSRSKEEATCSGDVKLSWPGAEQFNAQSPPAQELVDGAEFKLYLDGQLAASGQIDTRTSNGTPTNFELTLSFRGKCSDLVDSSPDHPTGQENNKSPPEVCRKLMEGYRPQLIDKSGFSRQMKRFIIAHGESVERAMRRATREFGLNFFENVEGDCVLEKKGGNEGQGQALILGGRNFYEWSVKRDMATRMSKIETKTYHLEDDDFYGKDAQQSGKSEDKSVKGKRERAVPVDGDHDQQTSNKRAVTESRRRSASGINVTLKMSTWSDDSGQLWQVGKLHPVKIPVDQINDTLMIMRVQFDLTPTERTATITLVNRDTFNDSDSGGGGGGQDLSREPDIPSITSPDIQGGVWPELPPQPQQ